MVFFNKKGCFLHKISDYSISDYLDFISEKFREEVSPLAPPFIYLSDSIVA